MPLPLLCFPYLVLKNILLQMSPHDMVALSFCSKKASGYVKSAIRRQYSLSIEFDSDNEFDITIYRNACPENSLCRWSNNVLFDGFEIANQLMDLCSIQSIGRLSLNLEKQEEVEYVTKWLSNIFVEKCSISLKNPVKSFSVTRFLVSVQVSKALSVDLDTLDELVYERVFDLDEIIIPGTLRNLLDMNCANIHLYGVISNEDMNQFLRRWYDGCFDKLRRIEFYVSLRWQKLLAGMSVYEDCECKIPIKPLYRMKTIYIENRNGVKASIERIKQVEDMYMCMTIR
ncbi:hypothetical protein GCK72_011176 [Caenorhabditis remanei]|uniref:F-box domain-containing protein n=1 Tax=Caenorhabditis remanei TaxID=31234 RepID=A0A6A5H933_CAERE|nr:hypothetical protein GCK72_011175 [Caenorhabditis remanei]XP_053587848.1 hypothetical protein GCK72_011176 [Caenorhabditis remanei]KAF1762911.1 hypothetical protein GCK72_011175 [Caenorhabditis remanei]KAF1762912.1 hypothetical protein GCK72_011176 [Caenorhabditis remanei]